MNETVRQGLGIWGDNQVNAVTEAETAFMELTRQLGCAEDTICQLREERDATLKKLASTVRPQYTMNSVCLFLFNIAYDIPYPNLISSKHSATHKRAVLTKKVP